MKFCPLIENSLLHKVVPANDSKHELYIDLLQNFTKKE